MRKCQYNYTTLQFLNIRHRHSDAKYSQLPALLSSWHAPLDLNPLRCCDSHSHTTWLFSLQPWCWELPLSSPHVGTKISCLIPMQRRWCRRGPKFRWNISDDSKCKRYLCLHHCDRFQSPEKPVCTWHHWLLPQHVAGRVPWMKWGLRPIRI